MSSAARADLFAGKRTTPRVQFLRGYRYNFSELRGDDACPIRETTIRVFLELMRFSKRSALAQPLAPRLFLQFEAGLAFFPLFSSPERAVWDVASLSPPWEIYLLGSEVFCYAEECIFVLMGVAHSLNQ